MWGARWWGLRFWGRRYWGKAGQDQDLTFIRVAGLRGAAAPLAGVMALAAAPAGIEGGPPLVVGARGGDSA